MYETTENSSKLVWTGRILSAIPILFLLMDGVTKLAKPAPVVDAMAQLGYAPSLAAPVGILLLCCVALYLVPQTSTLGAVLLTGYLGAAVSAHVRVGNPLFSHILFPVYIALLLWGGLLLRDGRLRALLPVQA